jgi:hypothetical protein
MRKTLKTAVLFSIFVSYQAPIRSETKIFGSAGGYDVAGIASTRDEAGACMAEFSYEGPGNTKTTLFRTVNSERRDLVTLFVVNTEWSAEEGITYNLDYVFNDGTYNREAGGVRKEGIYKGFLASFPSEEFLSTFAKSSYLHIYKEQTVVDKLSLSGSSAGIALFKNCWIWLMTTERAAKVERDKFKNIPRDPFKKSETE